MKNMILKLSVLAMVSVAAQAQAHFTKMVLQNDILVGSKIYVRYDDIASSGYPGTIDDEGYCVIEDSSFNNPDGFNQFKRPKLLKSGTELQVTGQYERSRKNWKGESVVDQFVILQSPRGQLEIACSIDRNASESVGYRVYQQEVHYLEALGIKIIN